MKSSNRQRVFVTGAAGGIGSNLCRDSASMYDLKLMVQTDQQVEKVRDFGEVVVSQLDDRQALEQHMHGCDTLVHLAANPRADQPWDSVLQNNIAGTYNALDAAVCAGVQRLVFASSIHAVSGYPAERQIRPSDAGNPGDLYGVSKCFGEALCAYFANQHGRSAIAIRIGAYGPTDRAAKPHMLHLMNLFVSPADLTQLIQRCIEAPATVRFAVVHGVSRNRFNRLDVTSTMQLLGYDPQDDFTELNAQLRDLGMREKITPHNKKHRD